MTTASVAQQGHDIVGVCADQQVVYGHRDFEYVLPDNIRATFLWAPYTTNITAHMRKWYFLFLACQAVQ